jgi:hypothetical protein
VYVLLEETFNVAVTLPPAPPSVAPLLPLPPWPPSTSTETEVTPAAGVHVPDPAVHVTVTVVVPASLHVPVVAAPAGRTLTSAPATSTVSTIRLQVPHLNAIRSNDNPAS